ncbi:MAG: type II toxin-antitoxin system RelE/ParE family toxin [Bacteroidota bacterium]
MEVIWTKEALVDVKEIYNYYKYNASIRIAKNLKNKILFSTKTLNKQARQGQAEELLKHKNEEYRYLVTGNYKVIYKITDKNEIFIMKVFDCKRNPEIIRQM